MRTQKWCPTCGCYRKHVPEWEGGAHPSSKAAWVQWIALFVVAVMFFLDVQERTLTSTGLLVYGAVATFCLGVLAWGWYERFRLRRWIREEGGSMP